MPTEIHHVLGQCSMDAVQREARQLFRKVQVSLMLNCTDAFMMEFEAAMTRYAWGGWSGGSCCALPYDTHTTQ